MRALSVCFKQMVPTKRVLKPRVNLIALNGGGGGCGSAIPVNTGERETFAVTQIK